MKKLVLEAEMKSDKNKIYNDLLIKMANIVFDIYSVNVCYNHF